MAEDKDLFPADKLPDATDMRLAIVTARFNTKITERLRKGAVAAWLECGADQNNIDEFKVPGCFELPVVALKLAKTGKYDAIAALGAVIRGGTPHFEFVSSETARGIAQIALKTGVPVAFGVLTTDTLDQAEERAGGALGNKGRDAALAAVETALVLRKIPDIG